MIRLFEGRRCPECERMETPQRIRREPWMRSIQNIKHYRCRHCTTKFIIILGWITVKLGKSSKKVKKKVPG